MEPLGVLRASIKIIILKVIMETKYQNLINYIQEQISDGQLGPGEKVPSENQLSEQFHISRQTVRKAIGTLEEDGLVQRIRGSGTYVSFDRQKNLEQRNRIGNCICRNCISTEG